MGLIVINTMLMALDYYEQPSDVKNTLQICSTVIVYVFFCEVVLRVVGRGWGSYWSRPGDTCDAVVVILCVVLEWTSASLNALQAVRQVRGINLLRAISNSVRTLQVLCIVPNCNRNCNRTITVTVTVTVTLTTGSGAFENQSCSMQTLNPNPKP